MVIPSWFLRYVYQNLRRRQTIIEAENQNKKEISILFNFGNFPHYFLKRVFSEKTRLPFTLRTNKIIWLNKNLKSQSWCKPELNEYSGMKTSTRTFLFLRTRNIKNQIQSLVPQIMQIFTCKFENFYLHPYLHPFRVYFNMLWKCFTF